MACVRAVLLLLVCAAAAARAQLRIFNLRASDLPSDVMGVTDGYVKVFCGSATLGKTEVRDDQADPWWEEEFASFTARPNDVLRLEVHDSDLFFDDLLGVCQRQIKVGSHTHDCYLEKGGVLTYSYTLD